MGLIRGGVLASLCWHLVPVFRGFALFVSFTFMLLPEKAQSQPGMNTICHFNSGMRAGQSHDFAPLPPLPRRITLQ
jgi:hypothetical protein